MVEYGVSATVVDGVGTVSFSHPKANSLPSEQLRALSESIDRFSKDSKVGVIVLQSGGEKAFCAGASFDELLALEDEAEAVEYFLGFARVILSMRASKKFVIARVQGNAVGGAVGLIAAADYTIASEHASVRLSELALGFGPFVISQPLIRKIGAAAFGELAMSAAWRDASWALQRGLFSHVVSSTGDALDKAVREMAIELSRRSQEAMKLIKEIAWQGTEEWASLLSARAQLAARLALSQETREQLQAFQRK